MPTSSWDYIAWVIDGYNQREREEKRKVGYTTVSTTVEGAAESDEDFDVLEAIFTKKFKFDNVNTTAMPVLVYELNGNAVAWYDEEMQLGFIA